MIRRPPRSTQSRSSAASDVYKRQLAVPGDFTFVTHGPDIHQRRRNPLLGSIRVLFVLRRTQELRFQIGNRPQGSRLSHSPGVDDPEVVLVEARIILSGAAAPPTIIRIPGCKFQRSGSFSIALRMPNQMVGTPAVTLTFSFSKRSSRLSGSRCGPGWTTLEPKNVAVKGMPQAFA